MDGFYIGRYEMGDGDARSRSSSSGTNHTAVEMQGKYVYNYITWYDAYDICKRLSGTSESVESCLIYGCLWDATLEFLVESENKEYSDMVNSTSWGNYLNASFTYIDFSENEVEKNADSFALIPTGSTEYTNSCNIYDLAGNVNEWTQELYNNNRQMRGGNLFKSGAVFTPRYRWGSEPTGGNDRQTGCRVILYVK